MRYDLIMIIDGKKIAEEIKSELKKEVEASGKKMRLAVVWIGNDKVSEKFIEHKKKFGEEVGVDVKIYNFPADISTSMLRKKVAEISHIKQNTGVIVQLPLPSHINTQYILNGIVSQKDVDVLSARATGEFAVGRSKVIPPVIGAVREILCRCLRSDLSPSSRFQRKSSPRSDLVSGKNVCVFGAGRLVGEPVAMWLMGEGATVSVVNEFTKNPERYSLDADIIITGVGKPNLITADMIKDGAIVIDAGTAVSEDGRLRGDVDFDGVSKKVSLITPVPGGVGPITVAMVFKNLIELRQNEKRKAQNNSAKIKRKK